MPHDRNWELRIEDILESIARIKAYTGDLDFESFAWDERTVDAVLRHFGVIGEAANHCPTPSGARIQKSHGMPCGRCGISSSTNISV